MKYLQFKFTLQFFIFGLILCFCTGCPYESAVPISDANVPINTKILGKWTKNPASNDFYEIKAKTEFLYLIEENIFNKTEKVHEIKKYYAHLSKVDSTLFLNISPRDSLEKVIHDDSFLIYKLNQSDSLKFTLKPLSEHIEEQFTNKSELENFVRKYMNLSFFYGDDINYERFDFRDVHWKN